MKVWYLYGYVVAQKFNLSLDLGYYYAFVFDKKLQEPDCKQPSVPRRLFDRFRSTTYEQRTADDNPFAFGSDQYFVSLVTNFVSCTITRLTRA